MSRRASTLLLIDHQLPPFFSRQFSEMPHSRVLGMKKISYLRFKSIVLPPTLRAIENSLISP